MEIVEKEAMTLVGLTVRANWQDLWIEMPRAWREFVARYTEVNHREANTFVDVSLDKMGDEYLQLVCTQISQVDPIPKGMRAIEIPAQRYVHYKHTGPIANIAESFGKIYAWAREHKQAVGEFKLDFGYTAEGDELDHDLYVGLLPIKAWRDVGAA